MSFWHQLAADQLPHNLAGFDADAAEEQRQMDKMREYLDGIDQQPEEPS